MTQETKPGFAEWWDDRLKRMTAFDTIIEIAREAWAAAIEFHKDDQAITHANQWYGEHSMPSDRGYIDGPGPWGTPHDTTP